MNLYNEAAADQFNTKSLDRCSGCGRTFNSEALVRHQKMCLKGKQAEETPKPPGALRPKMLMCYICGREYGTQSLEIHIKTCKNKWDVDQEKKPKN